MLKLFTKIFGSKSERDLKPLWPYVEQINAAFEQLKDLSNDALRSKTLALKEHIQRQLQPIVDARDTIDKEAEETTSTDIDKKEQLYEGVDKLKQQYNQRLEEVLMDILPQAFAIVKETARRFKAHKQLMVTATAQDQILAASTDYVTMQGDQAIWHNQWEAADNPVVWDMLHYDVQLIGGIILHQGKIAEMATGEGKTLVATLPAFLNALVGKGVHIVTVNDYLAKRDAAWMGPLYTFHGLTVDCINKHRAHSQERQQAYQADIVYGTNNEFGFDYLRDNMATSPEELVQREPHFAMVDEVDSVLIDDARTPLIISGPVEKSNEQEYNVLNPRIQKLYEAQKELVTQLLQTARKKIGESNEQEGGIALFRAYRGLPKHKPLIKYLSEVGIKKILRKTENYYLQDNSSMMPEADEPLLFTIDERHNSIEFTEQGLEYITQKEEDPHFFVLPDIGLEIAHIENTTALDEQEKHVQKEVLINDYTIKSQRIHVLNQLLKAYTLFEKDVEYIVVNNKVKIVDEQTGRILEGRRYSDGLHQAIEAKERVKIEKASQTYATITLQNYFRMYHKLAGMTGTAATEAGEFWEIYGLDVIVTPTNRPIIRADKDDKVYKTALEKFQAIIEEITILTQQGRPVLVGTTSVEISELVSSMLTAKKIKHQVLNAKHHQKEAEIVAEAGKASTVTIATNMAGRGTDIKLTPEAKAAGGLAIIGTERHESRRVDRQLRGRAGRQGDVGSSQFFVSLEDNLMRLFGSERIARIMDKMGLEEGEVIQHSMITRSIERAQKKVEQSNFAIRKRLLEYDNVMNAQREVIYTRRRHALVGKRSYLDTMNMVYDTVADLLTHREGTVDRKGLPLNLLKIFGKELMTDAASSQADITQKIKDVYQITLKAYEERKAYLQTRAWPLISAMHQTQGEALQRFSWPFTDGITVLYVAASLPACIASKGAALVNGVEKAATLHFIDHYWKEHLRAMDDLKQSVQNAVYERQDPLLIYKFEGYKSFQQFIRQVNHTTIAFLNSADFQLKEPDAIQEVQYASDYTHLQESKQSVESLLHTDEQGPGTNVHGQPLRSQKIAQRNQRVTVHYADGRVKENVKFKTVEEDLANEKCRVVRIQ
ncbi:MAG: preprotein translocase subunit SecA [Bacteroidota bacterium]|jgi:preprotein translocase subunit SecA